MGTGSISANAIVDTTINIDAEMAACTHFSSPRNFCPRLTKESRPGILEVLLFTKSASNSTTASTTSASAAHARSPDRKPPNFAFQDFVILFNIPVDRCCRSYH
jgi:hypothetical protein